jgi:hypothetical protein
MTNSRIKAVPLVEKLKYISPKFFKQNNIKTHLAEVERLPFDRFKILDSFGPYVDVEIDSDGCTGCEHIYRLKIRKIG